MKRIYITVLIITIASSTCFARSKIVFDKTIHNFGNVPVDSKVTHTFRFKNSGTSTLIIERVRAGCSCTGTLLSMDKVKPGKTGKIKVDLYTDMRLGELTRSIYVYSNDKSHKRIRLVLMANVKK